MGKRLQWEFSQGNPDCQKNRKRAGICTTCGTRKAKKKGLKILSQCAICLEKVRAKVNVRKNNAKCVYCEKPVSKSSRVTWRGRGSKTLCTRCAKTVAAGSRRALLKVRNQVIEAYGGKCNCCGESIPEFLQIDHINNDGFKHRIQLYGKQLQGIKRGAGTQFYYWLRSHGFPKDKFQLLCANCNWGKHMNKGICPHQQIKTRLKSQ